MRKYIRTYIHIHTFMHTHTYIHVHAYIHTYMHTFCPSLYISNILCLCSTMLLEHPLLSYANVLTKLILTEEKLLIYS